MYSMSSCLMHSLCLLLAFMFKQLLLSCFHTLCSFALFYFSVFVLCSFVSWYGFALLWLLNEISPPYPCPPTQGPSMTHPDAHCHGETFYFIDLFILHFILLCFISINDLVLFFHLHIHLIIFRQSYLINAVTETRAKNSHFYQNP